jgi:hypothetical protein
MRIIRLLSAIVISIILVVLLCLPAFGAVVKEISPIDYSDILSVDIGDGCILYNGYIYLLGRWYGKTVYKIDPSDYSIAASRKIEGDYAIGNDGLCQGGGFIWCGCRNEEYNKLYKLSADDLTGDTVYTTFTNGPKKGINYLCSDDTYVYIGGYYNSKTNFNIGKLEIATGIFTQASLVTTTSWDLYIHSICEDGDYLYCNFYTGIVMKVNKSDLSEVSQVSDTGGSHEDIDQDTTHFYVKRTTAKQYLKSDLSVVSTTIPDIQTDLDAQAILPDGKFAYGDSYALQPRIFILDTDFSYMYALNVSGFQEAGRINKFMVDGTVLHVLAYYAEADSSRLYKFNISDLSPSSPTVSTQSSSSVSYDNAIGNYTIVYQGGSTITERGICLKVGSGQVPTTGDIKFYKNTDVTIPSTAFTEILTDLSPNTTYSVRSYAINSIGTSYGSVVEFTTLVEPEPTTPLYIIILPIFFVVILVYLVINFVVSHSIVSSNIKVVIFIGFVIVVGIALLSALQSFLNNL